MLRKLHPSSIWKVLLAQLLSPSNIQRQGIENIIVGPVDDYDGPVRARELSEGFAFGSIVLLAIVYYVDQVGSSIRFIEICICCSCKMHLRSLFLICVVSPKLATADVAIVVLAGGSHHVGLQHPER